MAYSPQDVYAKHLVSRRGYPLWTPEPNMSLPDVYVREGLKIGDVGVVVPEDGSFDVFFNVCLPPTHSLHRETGVPDNFAPILLNGRDITRFPEAESAGRIISTSSVARAREPDAPDEDPGRRAQPGPLNYEFTLSSREGAVLILPEGAERYYLRNERSFMNEAIRRAVDWYNFAEQCLGRIISHDSLYLIAGFHKARSWSLAAYQQAAGAGEASAQFKAVQVGRGNIAASYTWVTTHAMDWRVGPSDQYYNGIANQTVFIQGFKIAVRPGILAKRVNVKADFPSVQTYRAEFSSRSRFSNFWGGGSRNKSSSTPSAPKGTGSNFNINTTEGSFPTDESDDIHENITISRFPQAEKPFHPSDIINQHLLREVPSATVAITNDSQWTMLLKRGLLNPGELSQEDCLVAAVISNYDMVCTQEGAVYLDPEGTTIESDDGNDDVVTTLIQHSEDLDIRCKDQQDTQPISKEVLALPPPTEHSEIYGDNNVSTTACSPCRVRNISCDLATPECGNCQRRGLPCPYVDVTKGKECPPSIREISNSASQGELPSETPTKDEKGTQPIARGAISQLETKPASPRRPSRPPSLGHVPSVQKASNSLSNLPRKEPGRILASYTKPQASNVSYNLPSYQVQQTSTPNVLVVGETGVGKSSVINLIAGETLADVSCCASGRTMEAAPYNLVLIDRQGQGHSIRLFDTVGLNEPSLSKNDYLAAIKKANVLITQLLRTGGICLLVFCIRGGRITSVTQNNYRLFRDILCQNQVPVAFVITGMENEQPMEGWWDRNVALFERSGLFCTSHVCVTATPGLNNIYTEQYQASRSAIHNILLDHISGTSWKPERGGWFIHLAGKLLKWTTKLRDGRRHLPDRSRALTVEKLARHLEEKCNFRREDAVELAGKIWAKRTEHSEPDLVKGEDEDDLSDIY